MRKRKDSGTTSDVGRAALMELALDLRWSWHHGTDELWSELDPELWTLTRNPWVVLQTASPTRLGELLARPAYRERVERLLARRREYRAAAAWFQQTHPQAPVPRVAYFSMEFGLSEALPIYSGGLGNVAGDQLKAASDLGVPVVGVGLLYQQGYFRQVIAGDGSQDEVYPYNDPAQLPITPARGPGGEWLRLSVPLPGGEIWLRAWQVHVGRVVLYLLDSNDPANPPAVRGTVSELYGSGAELRLRQELLLGIGGWRVLRALGLEPEVCHLNEGHAAFAVLERARTFMKDSGQPFDVALAVTRAGNLFTTHTRCRPASIGSPHRSSSGTSAGTPRRSWASSHAASCRSDGHTRTTRRAVQHGLPRRPRQRGGQWRQPPARRREPPHLPVALSPVARDRGASRARHQRCPYALVGLGRGRCPLDPDVRRRAVAGHPGHHRAGDGVRVR